MWAEFTTWQMSTPWGDFVIGVFDGFLLWFLIVSVASVFGSLRVAASAGTRRQKEDS
jgi:hypothetical protein